MSAACNGMAVHGGLIPSGASFLCFTDYARPALRLAALMKIRVVHVFTHDSIGLGEDGPTHQPIEHFASLRAMPNMYLWRPADSVETVECWQAALEHDAFAFDPRADPAEPARAAPHPCRREPLRRAAPTRLRRRKGKRPSRSSPPARRSRSRSPRSRSSRARGSPPASSRFLAWTPSSTSRRTIGNR